MIYVIHSFDVSDPSIQVIEAVATSKEKAVEILRNIVDPLLGNGYKITEDPDKEFLDVTKDGSIYPKGTSLLVVAYDDGIHQPCGKETVRNLRALIGR